MATHPPSEPLTGTRRLSVLRVVGSAATPADDVLAVEEPLEIRLVHHVDGQPVERSLSITMRTPGHDLELAVGFLLTEGVIQSAKQLVGLKACGPVVDGLRNTVKAELEPGVAVDAVRLERHFYTTSSCGVCGKSSLEALRVGDRPPLPPNSPALAPTLIHTLPDRLREAQAVFEATGGLHAAALFDAQGTLLALREDVGRHNAVDKLIGAMALADRLPLSDVWLLVSGRASFELVQKALVAGIPAMAAVGAPSSLAVSLAEDAGMTLLGFVRQGRFNVYAGASRVAGLEDR
jgi:FdhD protein